MEKMRIKPNLSRSNNGRQAGVCLPPDHSASQAGFTLLEVMIVVVIIGIMSAVALPAFSSWQNKQALRSASQSLMTHLKQARVIAIAQNRSVSITITSNSYTYDADTTGSCGPCRDNLIPLSQFSGNLGLSSTRNTITFSSRGSAGNATITLSISGQPDTEMTVNIIGRAYYK